MNKTIIKCLLLIALLLPARAKSGPAYPACILACELACTGTLIIPVLLPAYLACASACPLACIAACFGNETRIVVAEAGKEIEKNIKAIKAGDMVLTLENGKPKWTRVLRNVKTQGKIDCIQIDAQNAVFSGDKTRLQVTPEHGLILVGQDSNLVIGAAKNVQVGDTIIAHNGAILSIVNVMQLTMDEKYTLETVDGTVVASGILVTTLCNEEVGSTKQNFDSKISDWQKRHKFNS